MEILNKKINWIETIFFCLFGFFVLTMIVISAIATSDKEGDPHKICADKCSSYNQNTLYLGNICTCYQKNCELTKLGTLAVTNCHDK
jgi:hypothetical protein